MAIRPIRVLFIVDSLYWVIGNFSRQITRNNPAIQATTCSQFAVRKTIKRFGSFPNCFDVVHFLRSKTIPRFWGAFPIVTTLHHVDSKTSLAPFYQSDAVMTVSCQWLEYLTKLGISKSHQTLVPFGVDTHTFYPPAIGNRLKIRRALNFSSEEWVLGFSSRRISNIDDRKGVNRFLKTLQKLRRHLPKLATLIIGPGWQTLAREILTLGIPCTLVPYEITHERIARFYKAMDFFWVTSRIEGGPLPLLEAMASGLPCISTPVGAALDLIKDHSNGFLVPFDSPYQFVDRTLELVKNQDLRIRIGNAARKTIVEERQWSQAQEKLKALYSLAINNFRSKSSQNFCQNSIDETTATNACPELGQTPMPEEIFYSPGVQSWIQACERINGFRMMVEMKEWKVASQFGLLALRTRPFDLSLWMEIISVLKKSRQTIPSQLAPNESYPLLAPKQPL